MKCKRFEETSARLEKTINVQVADIRSIEKSNVSIKSKIEQKRLVNEPEKNQIKDLDGFVKALEAFLRPISLLDLKMIVTNKRYCKEGLEKSY